jgi:hypothetical protein
MDIKIGPKSSLDIDECTGWTARRDTRMVLHKHRKEKKENSNVNIINFVCHVYNVEKFSGKSDSKELLIVAAQYNNQLGDVGSASQKRRVRVSP